MQKNAKNQKELSVFSFHYCYSLKTKTRRDLLLLKYERENSAERYEKIISQ